MKIRMLFFAMTCAHTLIASDSDRPTLRGIEVDEQGKLLHYVVTWTYSSMHRQVIYSGTVTEYTGHGSLKKEGFSSSLDEATAERYYMQLLPKPAICFPMDAMKRATKQ